MVILPSSINLLLRCVQPCVCALLYIIIVGLSLSNHHYKPLCGEKKVLFQIKRLFCCCLSAHFKGCASTDFHIFICNLFLMSNTYLNHFFISSPFSTAILLQNVEEKRYGQSSTALTSQLMVSKPEQQKRPIRHKTEPTDSYSEQF